jgi:hypothetical protein
VRARNPPGGLDTVHVRHAHVHQHHIGALCLDQIHSLHPRTRFTDDDEVRLGLDEYPQAAPQQRLIVGDQYPDLHLSHAGPGAW